LGLGAGEGAGGGEHSPIDVPCVIQEVADGDLELFLLSRGGRGGRVGDGAYIVAVKESRGDSEAQISEAAVVAQSMGHGKGEGPKIWMCI
jgi:hypothetical protein